MNTTTTTTEPDIKSVIQNKAMHMAGSELCANTRAAVTAHVAQGSRTAHLVTMDDLYALRNEVLNLYCATDSTEFHDTLKVMDIHINELIQKHQ